MGKKKKLRLILFEACDRNCTGCCNKDWDLPSLEIETDFSQYDLIMLTGGEPMTRPNVVIETAQQIREQTSAPIILYTAKSTRPLNLLAMLLWVDGITLTLHDPSDVVSFVQLNGLLQTIGRRVCTKGLFRLNVFKGIDLNGIETYPWKVKGNLEWIKNCPLPDGEVLRKRSVV